MDKYERILGGLFGVACGDALGGTLEFMTKDEIKIMAAVLFRKDGKKKYW